MASAITDISLLLTLFAGENLTPHGLCPTLKDIGQSATLIKRHDLAVTIDIRRREMPDDIGDAGRRIVTLRRTGRLLTHRAPLIASY
jgi:hypothetical protein